VAREADERGHRRRHDVPRQREGGGKKLTALLDVIKADVEFEGEEPPTVSGDDRTALDVWRLLHNGSGGLDWAGLPFVVDLYGIQDVEGLVHRLGVIKTHQPLEEPAGPET
jgi:hypothetical protein